MMILRRLKTFALLRPSIRFHILNVASRKYFSFLLSQNVLTIVFTPFLAVFNVGSLLLAPSLHSPELLPSMNPRLAWMSKHGMPSGRTYVF